MTAPSPGEATALTTAYLAAMAALRTHLLTTVGALFTSHGYRDAAPFITAVVPIAEAAQMTAASLTNAHLAHLLGTPPVGVPKAMVTGPALRGVNPTELWRRPHVRLWTALSRGRDLTQATAIGSRGAQSLAATNLQLAKTHTAREVFAHEPRVSGYHRVLTGATPCALCQLASTARYPKTELMPIHPGCSCGITPIIGDPDPPFDDHHAVLLPVQEHKELGPVLTTRTNGVTDGKPQR